jgi:hypothetical protein
VLLCLPISLTYVFYFLVMYCNKIKNIIFRSCSKSYFHLPVVSRGNRYCLVNGRGTKNTLCCIYKYYSRSWSITFAELKDFTRGDEGFVFAKMKCAAKTTISKIPLRCCVQGHNLPTTTNSTHIKLKHMNCYKP